MVQQIIFFEQLPDVFLFKIGIILSISETTGQICLVGASETSAVQSNMAMNILDAYILLTFHVWYVDPHRAILRGNEG